MGRRVAGFWRWFGIGLLWCPMEWVPWRGPLEGAPGLSSEAVLTRESSGGGPLKLVTFSDSPGNCTPVWSTRGVPLDWAVLRGSCGGVPWRGSFGEGPPVWVPWRASRGVGHLEGVTWIGPFEGSSWGVMRRDSLEGSSGGVPWRNSRRGGSLEGFLGGVPFSNSPHGVTLRDPPEFVPRTVFPVCPLGRVAVGIPRTVSRRGLP